MDLHRSDKQAQWKNTPLKDRNVWQKIAAKTNSIIAPANVISIVGFGVVMSGLKDIEHHSTARGITKIGIGRLLDVADGFTAEKTKTKSPLGELIDVVVDKVEAAMALPVLVKADILPKPVASLFLVQHAANTLATAIAKRRGAEIHPTKEGKLNTAGQWGVIGFYGLASVSRQKEANNVARGLELMAHFTVAATTYLGKKSFLDYVHDSYHSRVLENEIIYNSEVEIKEF